MAKNKVSEWDVVSDNNLDIKGINISDNMPPSFVNDAMREMMAQIKQWQSGLYEEPLTIKGDLDIQGGMTLDGAAGTSGQFLMSSGPGETPQWGSAEIPDAFSPGMIILWSGLTSTIPTGWALCNGTDGTPNLTDRFIMGAGNTYGVNQTGEAVFLDFASAFMRYGKEQAHVKGLDENDDALVKKLGQEIVKNKYGNLFQMYEKIVDQNPYETPMMIYPAVHYTMGGVWVDYNLMTTVPGLYAIGEANFSDHGANRLGASALMQGLADGYFVLPYTIGDYLADDIRTGPISTDTKEFDEAEKNVTETIDKLINNNGSKSVDHFHKRLGKIMWNKCGMARNEKDLKEAIVEIAELRAEFWKKVRVPGEANEYNEELAKAGRVADFLELGELFAKDALVREESAGGHFREEYQTTEGEATRRKEFQFVSAWEYNSEPKDAVLHKEDLVYENIEVKERSYK